MTDIAVLFVAYLLSQFFRVFLAVLAPTLIGELGVTAVQLSDATGVWFAAFAAAQIPNGLLLDRFGPRRVAAGGLGLLAGGGAALFAVAEGPAGITVAMALIGAGCAPLLMSGMVIFARRFEAARFATWSSWMIGFGSLGNVMGSAPLGWAVEAVGWRAVMGGLAGASAVLGLALLALMRDPPRAEGAPAAGFGFAGYAELLRMPVLWPILALGLFNYAVSAGVRGIWAGPYLAEVHGLSAVAVGEALVWMSVAMGLGNLVYGPLDRVLGTRKWLLLVGNGAGAAAALGLALGAPGLAGAAALLAALGFFGSSYGVLAAHFRSFVPARLTGRGASMINIAGIGGVGIGQFASGAVFATAETPGDPAAGFEAAFLYYGAALAAALTVYAFSRDAKP